MNWLDIVAVLVLALEASKGLRLGLVLSVFNIIGFILSMFITTKIYPVIYEYIVNNPVVYEVFERITEIIFSIIFYSRNKANPNFIPEAMSGVLVDLIIKFLSLIVIFWLVNILLSIVLGSFSFVLKAPILKQLNKVGGMIFGLIEGVLIIYLCSLILSAIVTFFPDSLLGRGASDSLLFNYLNDMNFLNMMKEVLSNKTYI